MKTLAYAYYYNSVLASQESRMRKLLTEKGENKLCANYIGQLTVKYVCCLIPILWSIRVIHIFHNEYVIVTFSSFYAIGRIFFVSCKTAGINIVCYG